MAQQEINISKISLVTRVAKNNPVGKVDYYTRKSGLEHHEFVFRLNGEVKTDFDDVTMYNAANTIEFLPQCGGSKTYRATTLETGECINVHFDTDIPLYDTAVLIAPKHYSELRHLFSELNTIWFQKSDSYYYNAMSVLYKILSIIISRDQKAAYGPHYKKIKIGVEYINENYCKSDLDYEKISAMCDISYVYFRKLFVECMKTSPAEYVMKKRIEYAKELLVSGQYKIGKIADMTGFCDVYHFSHIFKKYIGASPSKYLN